MAINKTYALLTAVVRIFEFRDSGDGGNVYLAGYLSFPDERPDARTLLTYYNDGRLNFSALDPEDPLYCSVQGRILAASSVNDEAALPDFDQDRFSAFDLYVDVEWMVPSWLSSTLYYNPHPDCRLVLCGVCRRTDTDSASFTLQVTQYATFSRKDAVLHVRCTIPNTGRFPEKVRHKFLPFVNQLAVVWGDVRGWVPGSEHNPTFMEVEVYNVTFMGKASTDSSSGSASTPVTPSKVRKEPDSPESPLSQLELKRRKFVADKPAASSSQSLSTPSPSPRKGNSKGKEKARNVVDEDVDA